MFQTMFYNFINHSAEGKDPIDGNGMALVQRSIKVDEHTLVDLSCKN
jgi:hypothetical protein